MYFLREVLERFSNEYVVPTTYAFMEWVLSLASGSDNLTFMDCMFGEEDGKGGRVVVVCSNLGQATFFCRDNNKLFPNSVSRFTDKSLNSACMMSNLDTVSISMGESFQDYS